MTPAPGTTTAPSTENKVFAFLVKFLNDAAIAEQVALAFPPIAPEAGVAQLITQGVAQLMTLHVAVTSKELDLSTLQQQPEIPIPQAPAKT